MSESDLLLSQNSSATIYLVREGTDGRPLVRKVLNREFPSNQAVRQFYNEYDVTRDLEIQGARRAYQKERWRNRHSLLLEYVDGLTADEAFIGGTRSLADFLKAAIDTGSVLSQIHAAHIIHNDISASNVIVNPDQDFTATIIDFGGASRADLQQSFVSNPGRLRGNLQYISPEQTGRMNRIVDYRTDLYSVGVLFYLMLTGKLPFNSSDAMELVHYHIAVTPRPPIEIRSRLPRPLSDMVMRLLAKNAEDRYQSAFGLVADLKRCQEALEGGTEIRPFKLARDDSSERFQVSEKLYGRAHEVRQLLASFERVSRGALEMVLVGGYSGTGKTALVNETHKPITARRGAFIRGKYDQLQRNIPYSALIQAFEEYINQLLTGNEASLEQWRDRIQTAVLNEGRVLTEVIPSLELVIGEQPEVPSLAGKESQNRFNFIFRNFVKAIARRDHPLVLFIDDLQWADSASLELLRVLLTDRESQYLLCVCAYRDNEVSPSHPFMKAVDQLVEEKATIERIEVQNLPFDEANQLIADSLLTDVESARALTEIVYEKTQGNAFFLRHFLMSLYEGGHLTHHVDSRRWCWDAEAISQLDMTDNVVELMAHKIRKLQGSVQNVLTMAACIGNRFDFDTLALICEHPVEQTLTALDAAMQEGLVHPADRQVSFVHDRIQQAAYSLTAKDQRPSLHLKIGRIMLGDSAEEAREERLFDIVNQLNQGIALVDSGEERQQLAELNLSAGIRAKDSAAYAPAYEYLAVGTRLLEPSCWDGQYQLALDLWTAMAESAYLSGQFHEMDEAVATVLNNARNLLDRVSAYEIRILAFKARNQLIDAIDTGLEILAELGVHFPENPNQNDAGKELAAITQLLEGRSTTELLDLPEMTDRSMIAALNIIAGMNSSVYWARAELFPFMVFKAVEISVQNGNTATSAFGYSTYGVILSGLVGDMKRAYDFGVLGLDLVEKFAAREWLTQLYTPHYALIMHWNEHTRKTLKPLVESFHIGLETGAIEYAVINANLYCIHSFLCGVKLDAVQKDMASYSEMMAASKQETNYQFNQIYHQAVLNLMGRSEDPLKLVGDAYDENEMLPRHLAANDVTASFFVFFNRLLLGFLFGDLTLATVARDEAEARLPAILAKLENTVFNLYDSLLSLALYPGATAEEQRLHLERVDKNQEQMQRWADNAPMNFRHKVLLVDAERCRVLGDESRAIELYDQAIELARENRYLNEEALAFELAGQFYLGSGDGERAEKYLRNAYQVYQQWEATAKMKNLASRFPSVVATKTGSAMGSESPHIQSGSLSTSEMEVFDLVSVLKAATAISEEIVLSQLLEQLMRILLQGAGAQRGLLMLQRDGRLFIEAEAEVDREAVSVLQRIPVDTSDIPRHILQYVVRTREPVVIGDAKDHGPFIDDPYLSSRGSSSILCSPIINQGRLLGLVYLENNLMPQAFTKERTELLSLLSGQIAISINNALLFDNLERIVAERTQSLEDANRKLERLSNLDGLTELFNRRFFDLGLKKEWERLRRGRQPLSLIFCDVDYFKEFNDRLGHLAGDDCLRKLSVVLRSCASRPSDLAARYGGEEFVILLPQTDRAGALEVASRVQDRIAELDIRHPSSTIGPAVTLSFGVSSLIPSTNVDVSAFVATADRALYQSKAVGRNRISYLDLED